MAFAEWKNRSKLFADTQRRLNAYTPVTDVCRAAYKAGQRDGGKHYEELFSHIDRCYKMLLSEPDTKWALFKAENILRGLLADASSNA